MKNTLSNIFVGALILMASPLAVQAQSLVTVAPSASHPQAAITVTGSSFGNLEAIDVYVDTVDTLLLVSTSTGTFSGSVTIPAAAAPGVHYITAIGRRSGDAAQQSFTVTTPWIEFGYGAGHLGWNPYENTVGESNVGQLGVLWSAAVNGYGGTPAVTGGRVYVGTYGGIVALSTATGAVLWSKNTSENFASSPAVGAGVVVAGSRSGNVYALTPSNGTQKWVISLGSGGQIYSSPVIVGGVVYIAEYASSTVYALQAATGAIVWSLALSGGIDASPAVVNGILYIGAGSHLAAVNAATGLTQWTFATGGSIESSPAVAGGVVYVGSDDGSVYAIKAGGAFPGGKLWSYATGAPVFATPALAYGHVYVGSSNSTMYALDGHSGALLWTGATGGLVRSAIVANGVVYVSSQDDTLYAFDAYYGGQLATWVTGAAYFGSPSISDGILYQSPVGGNVTAFALLGGTNAARSPARPPELSTLHPDPRLVITD